MDTSHPRPPAPVPDEKGLLWGFTRAFRVVARAGRSAHQDPGKWISFLPTAMSAAHRQKLFDDLAAEVLADPSRAQLCDSAKMACEPLWTHPDRVALMFYCDASRRQDLLARLRPVVRRHRKAWVARGELVAGDGFLGGWTFKTDAQTTAEIEAGTHPAQLARWMALMGEPPAPKVGKPRRPR